MSYFPAFDLARVFGALRTGRYAMRSKLAPFPVVDRINAPAAQSLTAVLGATLLATGVNTHTAGITDPDVPRNLRLKGNQAGITGNAVVTGTDIHGKRIQETFALNGTGTIEGNYAFKTVTSVQLPARNAPGDSVSVGTGNKLGLARPLAKGLTDVDTVEVDNVAEAAGAVDEGFHTVTPTTVPNAARIYKIFYRTDWF